MGTVTCQGESGGRWERSIGRGGGEQWSGSRKRGHVVQSQSPVFTVTFDEVIQMRLFKWTGEPFIWLKTMRSLVKNGEDCTGRTEHLCTVISKRALPRLLGLTNFTVERKYHTPLMCTLCISLKSGLEVKCYRYLNIAPVNSILSE